MNTSRTRGSAPLSAVVVVAACAAALQPATDARGAAAFNFNPVKLADVISATFSVDFAALTGLRFFDDGSDIFELNFVHLIDLTPDNPLPDADLSDGIIFIEFVMLQLETGIFTSAVDPSFFTAFETGKVGLSALFTDTDDGLFAIDFISLTIETITETIEVFFGSLNDGFGIGIPDFGDLPGPLPGSIPGVTGTGFDEVISSISINAIPAPGALALFGLAGLAAARRRRS